MTVNDDAGLLGNGNGTLTPHGLDAKVRWAMESFGYLPNHSSSMAVLESRLLNISIYFLSKSLFAHTGFPHALSIKSRRGIGSCSEDQCIL